MAHVSHPPVTVHVERHPQPRLLFGRHGYLGDGVMFDEGPFDLVVIFGRKLVALNHLDGDTGATTALGTHGHPLTPVKQNRTCARHVDNN